jgi:hypothetical protein
MDLTETLKNVSLIIASLTAIYGIGSWRREYRGRRRAELAEETLSLFYEARDAIRHIRSPFGTVGEGSTRKHSDGETPEQTKAYDRAYVAFERYNSHMELFNKLHSIRYRFMTQFSVEDAKPFDDLRETINEILASSQTLAQLWLWASESTMDSARQQKRFEEIDKFQAVLWEGFGKDDPIKARVEKCVADIEQTCKGILSSKWSLLSFFHPTLHKALRSKKKHS